ncbi:hypothetical protein [Haliangium sp.]|uniref:hypothetical protein n=1 Tax=Haliangium sp. TaxID=2663208 RepID=UPI003D0B1D8A
MQRHVFVAVRGLVPALGVALAVTLAATPARAGDNDVVLARLGTDRGGSVVGNNQAFRSLASELGVVLAPRLSSPADTLGFGGFQFTTDLGFTSISNDADHWRARLASDQAAGPHGGGLMSTVGVFARKGIWLPLPSFEVGAGIVHLMGSRMTAAQFYAKLALHEGYHDWPLPSLAIRGAASRMMGEASMDLTVASVDVSVGKELGIGSTFNLTPYGGWNLLIIVPRSEVIDKTPQTADDLAMNFVFRPQDDIYRHRLFAGVRLKYFIFALNLEGQLALAGGSTDDQPGTDADCAAVGEMTDYCDSRDQAGSQITVVTSLGVDF